MAVRVGVYADEVAPVMLVPGGVLVEDEDHW